MEVVVSIAERGGQLFTLKFAPLEARDDEAVLHGFIKEQWNATRLKLQQPPCQRFVNERYYERHDEQEQGLKNLATTGLKNTVLPF
jgi:hypothetical protein